MTRRRLMSGLLVAIPFAMIAGSGLVWAADMPTPKPMSAPALLPMATTSQASANAEAFLQKAKLPLDGPGLREFFKTRSLRSTDRAQALAWIQQLGAESFDDREMASAKLMAAGPSVLLLLKEAERGKDAEIARRAERCLQSLSVENDPDRYLAASLRLLEMRPPETIEVLVEFLMASRDEDYLYEAILGQIRDHVRQRAGTDPALVTMLSSTNAKQRAIAVRVLLEAGATLPKLNELANDADAEVRFHVLMSMIRQGDRSRVLPLIGLLETGPESIAYQVEDLLCQLLVDQSPPAALIPTDPTSRLSSRKAWESWWASHGDKLDLAKQLANGESMKNYTIVLEVDNNGGNTEGSGRVWECAINKSIRWEMTNMLGAKKEKAVQGPVDVQALPKNRFLIAEYYGRVVTERDPNGKILWTTKQLPNNPVSCQRLANGNTLVATMNSLHEFTPDLQEVGTFPRPDGTIYHARQARNGHTFYLANGRLNELDLQRKPVRSIPVGNTTGWGGFDLLPNGNVLVAYYVAGNRVAEINPAGKIVWEISVPTPTRVQRLRNGNILVAGGNNPFVAEYDRNKKEVWRVATKGRPFGVLRY